MSLIPLLFSDWWQDLDRSHHHFDQHFPLSLNSESLMDIPTRSEMLLYKPSKLRNRLSRYHPFLHSLSNRRNRGTSNLLSNKDNFLVTLDVQQFCPNEINVKVVDNNIVVEAKHEEKKDEHGWISRQFTRKYMVPNEYDIEQVESHLSSDGVLTISAPKKQLTKVDSNEKVIKIQFTGEPAILPQENPQPRGLNEHQEVQQNKKSTVKAA